MLARIRKSKETEGFTLIELLVVMIIIGILAAIAIPVFLNQRKKAQDSAAKADVSTLGKELATYFVDNCTPPTVAPDAAGLRYELTAVAAVAPCTTPTAAYVAANPTQDLGKISDNVAIISAAAAIVDAENWCIGVENTKGDKQQFKYSAAGGLEQGTC